MALNNLNAMTFNLPDRKLKVGFYGIAGCAGCLLSAIFNEAAILELISKVELKAFPLVKEVNIEDGFDVVFMEGLVACQDDLDMLKKIRSKTKYLVALGTCAHTGCIPAYRYFTARKDIEHLIYKKREFNRDLEPTAQSAHVEIDYTIPGCPPDRNEIVRFVLGVVLGKVPLPYMDPVCVECRRNGNLCVLEKDKMCMGPLTRGGCDAVCVNGGFECWGCRGHIEDPNIEALMELLKEKGFSEGQILQRMRAFIGKSFDTAPKKEVA